jgi:hypothetical protein
MQEQIHKKKFGIKKTGNKMIENIEAVLIDTLKVFLGMLAMLYIIFISGYKLVRKND